MATVAASTSGASTGLRISTPYVSRIRNHFLETSAICSPSRSISYSWSTMLPEILRS